MYRAHSEVRGVARSDGVVIGRGDRYGWWGRGCMVGWGGNFLSPL